MKPPVLKTFLAALLTATSLFAAPPTFKLQQTLPVGDTGRFDYITFDPATNHLYIPRATYVMVLDTTGKLLAKIPDTAGVHGVALDPAHHAAYTSNGKANTVTVFDTTTLKTLRTLKADTGPDSIIYDPFSHWICCMCGEAQSVTLIDATDYSKTDQYTRDTKSIPLGGDPEFAASDLAGNIYVNLTDKAEVVQIDTKTYTITAHWPLAPASHPTAMAIDPPHHLLFSACRTQKDKGDLVTLDTTTGKILSDLPIGAGADAAAFDPKTQLLFVSNRDGTLNIFHEDSPTQITPVQTVTTLKGAKTLALDPATDTLYLPTLDADKKFVVLVVSPETAK